MVERGGDVRAFVVDNRRKKDLHKQVRQHVEAGAATLSDEMRQRNVHTKTVESFWSLPERGLLVNYISAEPSPLGRDIDAGVPVQQIGKR